LQATGWLLCPPRGRTARFNHPTDVVLDRQGGHDRSGGLSHLNKCKGGRPRRRGGREVRGVGRAGGGCDTKEQGRVYRHDAPPDYVPARRGSCQHSGALTSALLKQIHSVDSDTLRSSDKRSSDTPAFIRREAISSSNTLTSASSEPPPLLHPLRTSGESSAGRKARGGGRGEWGEKWGRKGHVRWSGWSEKQASTRAPSSSASRGRTIY